MSTAECLAFDFFRLYTTHQLPGCSKWSHSWDKLVLENALREPAIRHAVVALASLHRAITIRQTGSSRVDLDQHELALAQYNKSITYIKTYIGALDSCSTYSQDNIEVILIVSLLFFCFELLYCNDAKAGNHLYTGLRILHERMQDSSKGDSLSHDIVVPVTPRDNIGILVRAFIELDYDGTVESPDMDQPYLTPLCLEEMPSAFASIDEAMVHLYALIARVWDSARETMRISKIDIGQRYDLEAMDPLIRSCLTAANLRRLDTTGHEAHKAKFMSTKQDLRKWMSAFATLQPPEHEDPTHAMARIHFFNVWLSVESHFDASESAIDRFHTQFEHLTKTCETYTQRFWSAEPHIPFDPKLPSSHTRPAFALGSGILECLYLIALKCRESSIRRRCIQLIRFSNFQGAFDAFYLAAMVEAVVDLEEERARRLLGVSEWDEFKDYEVPEEARILNVELDMGGDSDKHTFYKRDVGSFVYHIWADGLGSELERGEGVFVVERPLPSGLDLVR
ncbi:hypothetical protein M409DRAFT_57722 [Zasmidium cellare ATCC 36951]|uniref:Transcription factor domain-containing protein n=1 Tax=Zasmidium cellare ATCC 36951 TaxID=1080233 RepID=A0A6A6C7H1_ZASCE|nr:uncharacterized protein M409DRAFT_57722 [Zasmidium cellare ATCC 36951]KAF2163044.1 hypothetical protein M409DRAFT_57722 [Zasmidium cellare ATCC 36951]